MAYIPHYTLWRSYDYVRRREIWRYCVNGKYGARSRRCDAMRFIYANLPPLSP